MFRIGGDREKVEYIFELTDFILTELDPELGTAQPLLVTLSKTKTQIPQKAVVNSDQLYIPSYFNFEFCRHFQSHNCTL